VVTHNNYIFEPDKRLIPIKPATSGNHHPKPPTHLLPTEGLSQNPLEISDLKSYDIIKKSGVPKTYYQVLGIESDKKLILLEVTQRIIWFITPEEIQQYEKVSF